MKLEALNISLYKMGNFLMLRPRKETMNEIIFLKKNYNLQKTKHFQTFLPLSNFGTRTTHSTGLVPH